MQLTELLVGNSLIVGAAAAPVATIKPARMATAAAWRTALRERDLVTPRQYGTADKRLGFTDCVCAEMS